MKKKLIPRAHVRERVDLPAHIVIKGDPPILLPCRILNRSEGGAKIVMEGSWDLPNKLLILADGNNAVRECEVRWQLAYEAGLKFLHPCSDAFRAELLQKLNLA